MYGLQVAADCNFYDANPGGADPTSENLPCEVFGLLVSGGIVVSAADYQDRYASLLFTTNNLPSFAMNNRPPGTSTAGIYTAITGFYPLVTNGGAISDAVLAAGWPDSFIHGLQPRTAYGVSQDNRYLYMMTIDGRQGGYSDGAYDHETAYWILQFGAWNAINMDGGGSTALYKAGSTGNPVAVNHSSYVPAYGRERYIGAHFGVRAKPLPGFFNDINVVPSDTTASITWTTLSPSTTQVTYGLTTQFTWTTPLDATMTTNHAVVLTNLTPATGYYFAALSTAGTSQYVSPDLFFVTTNYVTTNLLFDLTNIWTYATEDLDGIPWTTPGYDDSGWDGSGPGVLWVDNRGPNPFGTIPVALLTQMPLDPTTGYPYITYYLRTHFSIPTNASPFSLLIEDWVDDGAVFYLNGTEIYRLRMPPAPTQILNGMTSTGYPCSGDATCPDDWSISGPLMTNLVAGDNVLAVEVHNYNVRSPDITFGMSLATTFKYSLNTQLNVVSTNGAIILSWDGAGFTLQQAATPSGPWADVPGSVPTSSPFLAPTTNSAGFFRLR